MHLQRVAVSVAKLDSKRGALGVVMSVASAPSPPVDLTVHVPNAKELPK